MRKYKLLSPVLYGVLTAQLFSAFIYLEHMGHSYMLLNTIFGLAALGFFLYMPKKAVLIAGFFIGLLWFYWIGYSFEYQNVGYMIPIITIGFAIIYMLFFGVLALTDKVYIRAFLLFGLSFFEPFDWNWLQIELIFVDSYIGIFKYQLILVLLALSLPSFLDKRYKALPLLLILFAVNYTVPKQEEAPLRIKLVQTDIAQDVKWKKEILSPTISMIFKEIAQAKKENYELIVFPESVIPLYLNRNQKLIDRLLFASKDISIVIGSLYRKNRNSYNVTYMFENGTYQMAKKLVLVPFGEYIPLPKFAQDFINNTFFSGASDFVTASNPTDFTIKGIKFRNAICYEATCSEIYEGEVNYMIATSNNAWFSPSIEPTLQKLLLRYYARKNGVTIYHSANSAGTGIIK